jgi:hypothetical protein
MATIDDQSIIDTLLERDGLYPGDEHMPVVRIVRFTNAYGQLTHGIVYEAEARMGLLRRYETEPRYCVDPVVIFRRAPWDQE